VVSAKGREILAVGKEAAQKFDEEKFNLRKLKELEVRKQYKIEVTNRFAALENLSDSEDMNRDWKNFR
jgi:glycine betaine/choline ABC-type transport system substrate-binding protein